MSDDWSDFINKKIKIIFEDGVNHYSKKQGVLLKITPTHLILSLENNHAEAINLIKILRVELYE